LSAIFPDEKKEVYLMLMRSLSMGVILTLLSITAHALDLTGQDNGRSVSVPLNETLTVTLAGNPTTGYLWELAALDREVLVMESEPSYAPDSTLTGAGGKFTFRFTPKKRGTATLKLVYRRSWEQGVEPLQTFELIVAVAAAGPRIAAAGYRSATGEMLKASFDLDRNKVTVTLPDGRSVALPAAPSASGARYSNGTETFWEHQGIGRFFREETVLFEGALLPEQEDNKTPK
jgi:predicted secreted protein